MRCLSIFLLLMAHTAAAQLFDLGKCDLDSLNSQGFRQLKKELADARIIVIGEQVHGVGTDYKNFAFLTRFLHEDLGFNVILQEFCFYQFGNFQSQRIASNLLSSQIYREAMYWPQAKAKENDLLFDYLDSQNQGAKPMVMEGFDPRFFGRKELYKFCDSLLMKSSKPLFPKGQWTAYLKTLDNVLSLEYRDSISTNEDKVSFLNSTDALVSLMVNDNHPLRTIQLFRNIKSFAENAWNIGHYANADRFYARERQMAENIIWFATQMYPDDKIIVRMHNGHAAKNIQSLKNALPDSLLKSFPNVGSLLHEHFGDSCIHLASTYYSGSYCKWDYKARNITSPRDDSIESDLHEKGYDYAYMNLEDYGEAYMFFNEFNSWVEDASIKMDFKLLFDGIIFINDVKLPTEIPLDK